MKSSQPPKILDRLFLLLCKDEMKEELLGDLHEYYDDLKFEPAWKRKLLYCVQTLSLLKPFALKSPRFLHLNRTIMLRNYFTTSYRTFMKHPLNTFINVFGLSTAIGMCLLTYGYADWVYQVDDFHENKDELFLLTYHADRDGTTVQYATSPRPIADLLLKDISQVKRVCQLEHRQVVVKNGNQVFHEKIRFTDASFLEMFTFPLKWGHSSSLSDINSIILSEEMAIKYFGYDNPVDEKLLVKYDDSKEKLFKVGGVAAAFPKASSFEFDFLVNTKNLKKVNTGYDLQNWEQYVDATFIQLKDAKPLHMINLNFDKYTSVQNNSVSPEWAISSFELMSLESLGKQSKFLKGYFTWNNSSNFQSIIYLTVVSTLLLMLACFNYINIAIVSATKRLKEIGLRKTLGAHRGMVIFQFLTENILITLFALIMGLILGVGFFIPGFERLWNFDMGFTLLNFRLWGFLIVVLLVTGLVSGFYPSLYVSKFEVVNIMKGTVRFGRKNPLTKILLTVQLAVACILITSAVMFSQNTSFLTKRSWGYMPEHMIYAQVSGSSQFEILKDRLSQNPKVNMISGSSHHLGKSNGNVILSQAGQQYEADLMGVSPEYFETTRLQLKSGRTFIPNYQSEKHSILINEALARRLSIEEPVGTVLKIDNAQHQIIGVIEDFHHFDFSQEIQPTAFLIANPEDYHYLVARVIDGSDTDIYTQLRKYWLELYPETPFQGGYQTDVWGTYYSEIDIHAMVWQTFALIAIITTALGLFGLITLNISGRIKEFSIRKVLGAGLKHMVVTLGKQYLWIILCALVFGGPLSYYLIKTLIEAAYTYHMPVNMSGTLLALLILCLVIGLTLISQVRKVFRQQAVEGLKVE
ncbi:MAG: FtsX-like permease family protein [Marinoscillum sp.]